MLSTAQWVDSVTQAVRVAKSELDWLGKGERWWVRQAAITHVKKALTVFYPSTRMSDEEMETALRDFIDWLAIQEDRLVLDFVWDVLSRRGGLKSWDPIWWLDRSGRLSRDLSYDSLKLALTLRDEAKNMHRWPDERWDLADWQRDSQVYFTFTSHPSYVVRAMATMALGRLYLKCVSWRKANAPSVAEILKWVHEQQLINPGIAGAFLNGTDWSNTAEDLSAFSKDFDFRSWFLDTLRLAKPEPDVPDIITIEFYAHEYFEFDEAAIRELLRMGRKHLAVMTATQAYKDIDRMAGVLHEMADSEDANVARAIQEYLKVRAPHAGMQFMPERD